MKTPIGKIVIVVLTVGILFLVDLPSDETHLSGNISGLVMDAESTKPISGANVTLKSTGETFYTDSAGRYELGYITPGYYKISVSKQGYKPLTKKIRIISGETITKELFLRRSRS